MKLKISHLSDPSGEKPKRSHSNDKDKKFYSSISWKRLRKGWFNFRPENVLCAIGRYVNDPKMPDAEVVDHVIRKQAGGISNHFGNFMSLSTKAHQIKRALESNGYYDNLIEGKDFYYVGYVKIPTEEFKCRVIRDLAQRLYPTLYDKDHGQTQSTCSSEERNDGNIAR